MTRALSALLSSQTIGPSGGNQISFSGSNVLWGGTALLTIDGDGSSLTGLTTSQIAGLGTAAPLNVGTGANNIVQLDGSGNLPAVDGSALIGLASSQISGLGTAAALDVGTGANNVVQLDGAGALPALDGSNLTGISGGFQESDLDSIDNAQAIGWADAQISRDAAGTLAQRNGTNAQAFHVYNTYTDASNYERGVFRYVSNVLEIGHEPSGTGSWRTVAVKGASIELYSNFGLQRVAVATTGALCAGGNGTINLGNQTGLQFRDLFIRPSSSLNPTQNGDLCIEATDNTTLTFKLKGSDSVVRTGTVTLS